MINTTINPKGSTKPKYPKLQICKITGVIVIVTSCVGICIKGTVIGYVETKANSMRDPIGYQFDSYRAEAFVDFDDEIVLSN